MWEVMWEVGKFGSVPGPRLLAMCLLRSASWHLLPPQPMQNFVSQPRGAVCAMAGWQQCCSCRHDSMQRTRCDG